ncbi:MAG: M28 family peptidase, partial [Deltaproteobacteria bacterium]|nr:M28 family peptidase [Deltaproteobacteria bacterium]
STKLGPRDYLKGNLDQVAHYIEKELKPYTNNLQIQSYTAQDKTFKNIIAHFKGNSSQAKLYVIGAHYDAYQGLPGADDNASGIAGLIELARILSESPIQDSVELVAYASEEPPYFRSEDMGSFRHAQKLKNQQKEIELMVSLEMIGYFSDQDGSQDYPLAFLKYFYPKQGNFIALVSNFKNMGALRKFKTKFKKHSEIPVYSLNAFSLVPGIDFSDHYSYWQEDYPALMLTDTAFYRNKAYHTGQDTPDRLDYERMAKVIDGLYYALQSP